LYSDFNYEIIPDALKRPEFFYAKRLLNKKQNGDIVKKDIVW
jgi:hypothetical protein